MEWISNRHFIQVILTTSLLKRSERKQYINWSLQTIQACCFSGHIVKFVWWVCVKTCSSPAVGLICCVVLSKSSSFIIELVGTQPPAKIIKGEKSKSISLSWYKSIFGCSILGMEVAESQHLKCSFKWAK